MPNNLTPSRQRIDEIDRRIVELVAQRMQVIQEIGRTKGDHGNEPLRNHDREREVLQNWLQAAEAADLSPYHVGRILREVMNYSRRVQEEQLDRRETDPQATLYRVGFQGTAGSFSDLALTKLYADPGRQDLQRRGFRSFTAAVEALEAGQLDYTLLPIENTIAGSLNETYQLLTDRPLHIVAEEVLPVEHCLAALPGARLQDLRVVRSHAVALQQCAAFLARLGDCSRESRSDTASAAESVAADADPSIGAICSAEAAHRCGLTILERGIADQADNFTRFVLVGLKPEPVDPRLPCKVSLMLALNHRRGALARCLDVFAQRNINLTKLESRPRRNRPWQYVFYLDFDGHWEDANCRDALVSLLNRAAFVKLLGSYPPAARMDEETVNAQATLLQI